ncbi:MAG: S9 family peptidase [Candidatus Eremiobacteraeota bacterium]|nr:S9 family peptidase [Candidatus Eremiobacteraeota bacterium]
MRATSIARSFVTAFAAIALFGTCVARALAALSFVDLPKLVDLSSPQLSPDGRAVAVVVRRADYEHDRWDSNLDLVDVATGHHRTLTVDRKDVSSPQWSPHGDRLAFLADVDDKSQIFVMPMNGGDAIRITDAPRGVEQFAWRPDGAAVAYVAVDEEPTKKGAEKYRDAFAVANNAYLSRGPEQPGHLYVVSATGGAAHRLTHGSWTVLVGESSSTISWSRDGTTIVFARAANAILDTEDASTVWLINAGNGALHPLTRHTAWERDPQFSPDGTRITYTYAGGDYQFNPWESYVTTPSGGAGTNLSRPIDRAVGDAAWSSDSSALYVSVNDGTETGIFRVPLAGSASRIDLYGVDVGSPLAGAVGRNGALAFIGSTPVQPPEVYYAEPGAAPRKLTDYNERAVRAGLSPAESLEYTGPNGFHEDAVVTYPAGYVRGRKYPLVVFIHGGPTSASTRGFNVRAQLMAGRGWFVLQPNYRGSNNLGRAYQSAILHDVVAGPGRDIMAAVNALRARGEIDDRRIGVSGWSYGGVMTGWMITHYHLWRAAMAGAGVHDWIVDYSLADDIREDVDLFHGSPFAGDLAEWRAASPLTYARQITTPLLLLSDVGDVRVPMPESYELFRALRDLHKPVEFYVYPVSGHYPSDPVRSDDIARRWVNWFARHF